MYNLISDVMQLEEDALSPNPSVKNSPSTSTLQSREPSMDLQIKLKK